jgi:GcrA cell cycle regulator
MAPRHDNTFWNLIALQTLHQRWHAGESAGQIAEHLGCSRDAVCSKLKRLGLHRAHAPPTAHPKIIAPPKRRLASLPLRLVRHPPTQPPPSPSKTELYTMLAQAVANTARL